MPLLVFSIPSWYLNRTACKNPEIMWTASGSATRRRLCARGPDESGLAQLRFFRGSTVCMWIVPRNEIIHTDSFGGSSVRRNRLKRSILSTVLTDWHFWLPVIVLIVGVSLLIVVR